MITVFISYASDDSKLAEDFRDFLNDIKPTTFRSILVEYENKPSEVFNDKIMNNLEGCNVFIPLITEKSLNNIWVNQEIGYAFSLKKRGMIDVIPIVYDRKKMVSGFIHNQMDLPYVWNIKDIKKTFGEVKDFMLKEIPYPVELELIKVSEGGSGNWGVNKIRVNIGIENVGKRKIEHIQVGTVFKSVPSFIKSDLTFRIGKLPKVFANKFPADNIVYYTEIHDMQPLIVRSFSFELGWESTQYNTVEFKTGFYIIPTGHEPIFYEGYFKCHPEKVENGVLEKIDGKVRLEYKLNK